jgi:UDP-N-acetylglucosamine/UDP-N-acetylgalactosamine diphosphorylase
MEQQGCRAIFYFQVDNPLVRIADPHFLGFHQLAGADVSFKVVEKQDPDERVGVVISRAGRPEVIEYSNLPPELAARRTPSGGLELWAGSIAIHVFDRAFLQRIARTALLPMHRALKKVAYVDERGTTITPERPNAIKFESFIFDVLPLAERWAIVETDRWSEFEPLKNPSGAESPASVRQRMSDLYASWLEAAGSHVPRRGDGSTPFGIEISPLFALDAAELKSKIRPGLRVEGPLYLSPMQREGVAAAPS